MTPTWGLNEVADLLEIEGANPLRVRAYRSAARTVETLSDSVASIRTPPADRTTEP